MVKREDAVVRNVTKVYMFNASSVELESSSACIQNLILAIEKIFKVEVEYEKTSKKDLMIAIKIFRSKTEINLLKSLLEIYIKYLKKIIMQLGIFLNNNEKYLINANIKEILSLQKQKKQL